MCAGNIGFHHASSGTRGGCTGELTAGGGLPECTISAFKDTYESDTLSLMNSNKKSGCQVVAGKCAGTMKPGKSMNPTHGQVIVTAPKTQEAQGLAKVSGEANIRARISAAINEYLATRKPRHAQQRNAELFKLTDAIEGLDKETIHLMEVSQLAAIKSDAKANTNPSIPDCLAELRRVAVLALDNNKRYLSRKTYDTAKRTILLHLCEAYRDKTGKPPTTGNSAFAGFVTIALDGKIQVSRRTIDAAVRDYRRRIISVTDERLLS